MSVLAVREHHRFEAAGRPFVYLVPSAAIFALDETADDVMRTLGSGARSRAELVAELSAAPRRRAARRNGQRAGARAGDRRAGGAARRRRRCCR